MIAIGKIYNAVTPISIKLRSKQSWKLINILHVKNRSQWSISLQRNWSYSNVNLRAISIKLLLYIKLLLLLAVSDLLNLAASLKDVFLTQTQYGSVYRLPKIAGIISIILWEIIFNLTFPSVFSLALERCLAVSRPLWHKVRITSRVCRIWLVAVWLSNLVFSLTSYFILKYLKFSETVFFGFFILPPTLFVYVFAYVSIRRQHKAMATDDTMSERIRRTNNARLQIQNRFLFTVFVINDILIVGLLPALIECAMMSTFEQSLGGF